MVIDGGRAGVTGGNGGSGPDACGDGPVIEPSPRRAAIAAFDPVRASRQTRPGGTDQMTGGRWRLVQVVHGGDPRRSGVPTRRDAAQARGGTVGPPGQRGDLGRAQSAGPGSKQQPLFRSGLWRSDRSDCRNLNAVLTPANRTSLMAATVQLPRAKAGLSPLPSSRGLQGRSEPDIPHRGAGSRTGPQGRGRLARPAIRASDALRCCGRRNDTAVSLRGWSGECYFWSRLQIEGSFKGTDRDE